MISALYCGSFDPFTLGHLGVIEQALQYSIAPYHQIEKIYICIGINSQKTPLFSEDQRLEMIKKTIKNRPRSNQIEVIIYKGLTVDIAHKLGVSYLIRGIKKDDALSQNEEKRLSIINQELSKARGFKLETLFFELKSNVLNITSSSLVKDLCSLGQYITVFSMVHPFVHQKLMEIYLKPRFFKLFHKDCHSIADTYWQDLVLSYQNRSYHNLSHLGYMFNLLDIYTAQTGYKSADLELAIFAHDLVYDTTKDDNELQSATKVLSWYGLKYCKPDSILTNIILATSPQTSPTTKDETLIKDLDLSILGTLIPIIYNNYSSGIRQEYISYTKQDYINRRTKFLNSLLNSKRIFYTDFFYSRFETQAKENLKYEIYSFRYLKD